MDEEIYGPPDYRELAADIVAAYVSHNALSPNDLPRLIADTYNQLRLLAKLSEVPAPFVPPVPAVAVGRSVKEYAVTCLDCGKAFKSLKRHLAIEHKMAPTDYRAKWALPANYPMVAPSYAAERSALAKKIGLGRKKLATPPPKTGR